MMNQNRTELKRAAAGLAVLLLAAAVLTGAAAAAEDTSNPLKGGAFYYENVKGFDGTYKYLDNIIVLDGMNVLDAVSSYPEGTYSNTADSAKAFILKKLDAEVIVYLHDATNHNKIISSFSTRDGGVIPSGSWVSFKVVPNNPTRYSNPAENHISLKFISPSGTAASTVLGTKDYAAKTGSWNTGLETKTFQLDDNLSEGDWTVFAYFVPGENNEDTNKELFASYTPTAYLNATPGCFTVSSSAASITADTTTVEVGKEFTITISGKPGKVYYLKKNSGKYEIKPGQDYVTEKPDYYEVTIGQDGTTQIAVTVLQPGTFTQQLQNQQDLSTEDTCTVEVVRAKLTASSDKDAYYLGEDVTLSGTNGSSKPLFFYIEGKNLGFRMINNGEMPDALKRNKTGEEWETTINGRYFSKLKLDTAIYTIYISNLTPGYQEESGKTVIKAPTKEEILGPDANTTSVAVMLRQPSLQIISAPAALFMGENLIIKGVAENASQVQYYIFGNNKSVWDYVDVGRNGDFTVDVKLTRDKYDPGQYYVVIQHPMYDGNFNVAAGDSNGEQVIALNTTDNAVKKDETTGVWKVKTTSQVLFSLKDRQSSNAAWALCDAIDSENIDDIYTKCSFSLDTNAVTVDPIPSQIPKGTPFTVSGTATRSDGVVIAVELLSTLFSAESKHTATTASFITLITRPGDDGRWEVTFDTSGLNIDTYNISVSANSINVYQTGIRIVESTAAPSATPGETPSGSVPADSTPAPTPAAGTSEPQTASTPGFGAAVILAGFGAAALALSGRRL